MGTEVSQSQECTQETIPTQTEAGGSYLLASNMCRIQQAFSIMDTQGDQAQIRNILGETGLAISPVTNWDRATDSLKTCMSDISTEQENCKKSLSALCADVESSNKPEEPEIDGLSDVLRLGRQVAEVAASYCNGEHPQGSAKLDDFLGIKSNNTPWCAIFVNRILEKCNVTQRGTPMAGSFIGEGTKFHASILCGHDREGKPMTANGNWTNTTALVPLAEVSKGGKVWWIPPPYDGIGKKSQVCTGAIDKIPIGSIIITRGFDQTGHGKRKKR